MSMNMKKNKHKEEEDKKFSFFLKEKYEICLIYIMKDDLERRIFEK